jgi:hypothetical protein
MPAEVLASHGFSSEPFFSVHIIPCSEGVDVRKKNLFQFKERYLIHMKFLSCGGVMLVGNLSWESKN